MFLHLNDIMMLLSSLHDGLLSHMNYGSNGQAAWPTVNNYDRSYSCRKYIKNEHCSEHSHRWNNNRSEYPTDL